MVSFAKRNRSLSFYMERLERTSSLVPLEVPFAKGRRVSPCRNALNVVKYRTVNRLLYNMIYDRVALKNQTEHKPKEYAIKLTIKLTINNYKL